MAPFRPFRSFSPPRREGGSRTKIEDEDEDEDEEEEEQEGREVV